MDYSLVVGTMRSTDLEEAGLTEFPKGCGDQPFVVRDAAGPNSYDLAYYLGVIDFLQEWTIQKQIPMCIKMPVRAGQGWGGGGGGAAAFSQRGAAFLELLPLRLIAHRRRPPA
eukprot:SAG22_NODE_713_length_7726_cov_10.328701_2_plen_113_part_00